jgi:hypothetical protein
MSGHKPFLSLQTELYFSEHSPILHLIQISFPLLGRSVPHCGGVGWKESMAHSQIMVVSLGNSGGRFLHHVVELLLLACLLVDGNVYADRLGLGVLGKRAVAAWRAFGLRTEQ